MTLSDFLASLKEGISDTRTGHRLSSKVFQINDDSGILWDVDQVYCTRGIRLHAYPADVEPWESIGTTSTEVTYAELESVINDPVKPYPKHLLHHYPSALLARIMAHLVNTMIKIPVT